MPKTKTAKTKASQQPAATYQVKKDAQGRFWVVPKEGSAEHGPYATKKEATDAKAALASGEPAPAATTDKPASRKAKAKTKAPKDKKLSAIDAAAQVLADSGTPMNAKEMIEALEAKGLWKSPGGKTPHATLYSAIIREISVKGKDARFVKTERGKFTAKA